MVQNLTPQVPAAILSGPPADGDADCEAAAPEGDRGESAQKVQGAAIWGADPLQDPDTRPAKGQKKVSHRG